MISLICYHDNLFSSGVKSLLHLSITERNSCFEKEGHSEWGLSRILSIIVISTYQYCAKLNILWRACQRSLILRHRLLLYLMASIARSFLFFIQFINSHRPFLLFKISWILLLKNSCLEILTVLLKFFQSFGSLEFLYVSRVIWQLLSHHKFECLVILTNFEYLNHILFVFLAKSCIITSRSSLLLIWFVLRSLIRFMISITKLCFSLLFLTIVYFLVWISSSNIEILTIKGV